MLVAIYIFDYLCDLICILDMVLAFFTSYMSQGEHIFEYKKTAMHYIKTTFFFDLILTVPIDIFVWSSVWLHCLLRIPRMLRIVKVPSYFEHLERQSARPYFFTLAKVLGGALAITHVFACGYFAVAYYEGFGTTRFVPPASVLSDALPKQYLTAFWWATNVITRVGGSPLGPVTPLEQGLMIPVAFFTLFFVALVIGGVSEVLNRLGDAVSRFRRRVDGVNAYMISKAIPRKLRRRVKEYFDHLWARGGGHDDAAVLRDLPSHLRSEVSVYVNGEIVPKVPFFAHCSAGFIKAVVAHLKPHMFAPGDWIVREGDAGSDMFFISRGNVIISSSTGELLSVLTEGDFFGEICLLIDTQRTASARAATYCDLFSLDKKALSTVLEHFAHEKPILQELAETRIGHDFLRNVLYSEPVFTKCSKSFLNYLSDTFKFKRFVQGQMIYQSGTTLDADSVFFISSGSVIVERDENNRSSRGSSSNVYFSNNKSIKPSSASRSPLSSHSKQSDPTALVDEEVDMLDDPERPIPTVILQEGSFVGLVELLANVVAQIKPGLTPPQARRSAVSPFDSLDIGTLNGDVNAIPLEDHGLSSGRRNFSLRAGAPNTIVFVLKRRDILELLYDPEFVGQINVLERSTNEILQREAEKAKKARSGKDTFPLEDLHADSIGLASVKRDRGTLKKQMSAFLQSPIETAREMMRAKQRSASLSKKIAEESAAQPRLKDISGATPTHTPAGPSSRPPELALESALINAALGTPNLTFAQLNSDETLKLLQTVSVMQAALIAKLSSSSSN